MTGVAEPLGLPAEFGGPVTDGDNPLDEAGVFVPTSDVLPPDEFPQFASHEAASTRRRAGRSRRSRVSDTPASLHADDSYTRLTRTVDLSRRAATAAAAVPALLIIEAAYDHVIVEARTVGGDDWTTLPELEAAPRPTSPAECERRASCSSPPVPAALPRRCRLHDAGTSGDWNAFTGETGGWQRSRSTCPRTPGAGRAVDHLRERPDHRRRRRVRRRHPRGGGRRRRSRPTGSRARRALGRDRPARGQPANADEWQIGEQLVNAYAATSTEDTLLLGFGLEQLDCDASGPS